MGILDQFAWGLKKGEQMGTRQAHLNRVQVIFITKLSKKINKLNNRD